MILTDEEVKQILAIKWLEKYKDKFLGAFSLEDAPEFGAAIAQAQLDKALNRDDVLIKAADQSLPEVPFNYEDECREFTSYSKGQQNMLKPDSDGNVWVKCRPPENKG